MIYVVTTRIELEADSADAAEEEVLDVLDINANNNWFIAIEGVKQLDNGA